MVDIFDPATGKVTPSTAGSKNASGIGSINPLREIQEEQIADALKPIKQDLARFQAGLDKLALERLRMERDETKKFKGDSLSGYLESRTEPFREREKVIVDAATTLVSSKLSGLADGDDVTTIAQGMQASAIRKAKVAIDAEKVAGVLKTMPAVGSDNIGHGGVPNLNGGVMAK